MAFSKLKFMTAISHKMMEAFPEKLKRAIVVLVPRNAWIAAEAGAELMQEKRVRRLVSKTARKFFKEENVIGTVNDLKRRDRWKKGARAEIYPVVYVQTARRRHTAEEGYNMAWNMAFTLYHEFGHQVCRNGRTRKRETLFDLHRAECVADAFATGCLWQQFGKEGRLQPPASIGLLKPNPSMPHYTTDAVNAMNVLLAKKKDVNALTKPQLARMAERVADQRALPEHTIQYIKEIFSELGPLLAKDTGGKNEVVDFLATLRKVWLAEKKSMVLTVMFNRLIDEHGQTPAMVAETKKIVREAYAAQA